MIRRGEWLQAGLAALARDGEPGIRIDRLAAELGVTRGSFHHHFDGAPGYRAALLAHHEAEQEALLAAADEGVAGLSPAGAVEALLPLLDQFDFARERALRAWAVSDAAAAEVVHRIDASRFQLLLRLWKRALAPKQARAAALLPHLLFIGAISAETPKADIVAAFELLSRQARSLDPT